ncbi:MAG: glycosyltransferase family 4 protein [Flexistipes sinusarabici]|uniref:Glycosyltransferase family 4 protein n=1 Tax=Flexistipes sinusarabici TaxID=2352 RepID=A0A5D0MNJ2_FLESI|nr:glycosyltransferase [Flexistipes sinusarabici]TYB33972.1 MAG: glycosyltransferase family 4 protein [Flexistipes sinusarabici]
MRFLHVVNVRWYNATAWYAVNLSKILKGYGHDVIVLGLPGTPPLEKAGQYSLETVGLDLNSNDPLKVFRNIREVNKLLKRFDPDVVNCHRGEFFWYFAFKKVRGKKSFKLIRTRGDTREPKKGVFNNFIHSVSDRIITSAEIIKNKYVENLGISPSKISVVYGGVDGKKFVFNEKGRARVREEMGFGEKDYVVGIVGRFDYVKGHENLIRAVSKLYHGQGMESIRLVLIGYETNLSNDDIKNLLRENNIEEISVITGFRDDIADCLSALDVGVVASTGSEAVCRVAFELMAEGVPVVASDVGVLPEIIPEENIYSKYDIDGLANKIIHHSENTFLFSEEKFYEDYMKAIKVNV